MSTDNKKNNTSFYILTIFLARIHLDSRYWAKADFYLALDIYHFNNTYTFQSKSAVLDGKYQAIIYTVSSKLTLFTVNSRCQ